jgi:predicted Zn-dependent protease
MTGGEDSTEQEPLWIVGVGDVDPLTLERAADAAREQFDVDATVRSRTLDIESYRGDEEPYQGLDLAEWGRDWVDRAYVLVVTDADIEKPHGDPAFGLAYRDGTVGIVSTARLGEPNTDAFRDRLRTVVAQHVGYLVGMDACGEPDCLFTVADSPADLDRLGPDPCESCAAELDSRGDPILPGDDGGVDTIDRTTNDTGFDDVSELPESLWIVGVGSVATPTLEKVATAIREQYPLDVRVHPDPIGTWGLEADDGDVEEPYDGRDLGIYASMQADRTHALAVTDVDICHPDGGWAFGVSELGGTVGTISTARLGDPDTASLAERLRKEAIRHVGHVLGKRNCATSGCLFSPADTKRELDELSDEPCDRCRPHFETLLSEWPEEHTRREPDTDDGSANETTHVLVNAVRFWTAIGGYLFSLFLTALVSVTLLDLLPGVGVPESGAGMWIYVVGTLLVAYVLYRRLRTLVGKGARGLVGQLRGVVSSDG